MRGAIVVNGGLGGVMAATAAGVKAAGGTCVALLPGNDPDEANPDASIVLASGLGEMRNALIARCCAAMIAIGGGWGTLSEIAFARRLGRPVALLHSWDMTAPAGIERNASLHRAASVSDAVEWVFAQLTAG